MAIYKSSEMNTVIHRIKEKTVQNQIVLGALLPEQEILAFEQAAGVTLPEGFRRFLLEIGNGCTWKRERKMLPFPQGFPSLSPTKQNISGEMMLPKRKRMTL